MFEVHHNQKGGFFSDLLTIIKDLLPIMQRHGIAVDRKQWKEDTPLWDVFGWLAERFHQIVAPGQNGRAVISEGECAFTYEHHEYEPYWQIKKDKRGYFIETFNYYNDECFNMFFFMPVDYLPELKKKNPQLHDIILTMICLLRTHCDVITWEYETEFRWTLDWLEETAADSDEEWQKIIEDLIEFYTNGPPSEYLSLLRSTRNTPEDLKCAINAFLCKTTLDLKIIDWAKKSVELIESPYSWGSFPIPIHESCDYGPSLPECFRIVWNDEDEVGFSSTESTVNHANECGTADSAICLPLTKDNDEIFTADNKPDWPYKLADFLAEGVTLAPKLRKYSQKRGKLLIHTLSGLCNNECELKLNDSKLSA